MNAAGRALDMSAPLNASEPSRVFAKKKIGFEGRIRCKTPPERKDVYSRITAQIVEYLEKGVRPWTRPWNAEPAAGRITRPLRHNGQPYSGINVLMLWASAVEQGFTAPTWMTFQQALELKAHVRKHIGALATPDAIRFTSSLPKTRSGKIMRRLLRQIAAGDETLGDVTTLEDLSVMARLREDEE